MDELKKALHKRMESGTLRELTLIPSGMVDFSSNDYLGLANDLALKDQIIKKYQSMHSKNGATGSRLLTGNSAHTLECESFLAHIFGMPTSLLFGSGYAANLAFFSSIPQKGDTILYDTLSHACIKDGARLSFATKMAFRHNDLNDLEYKLKNSKGKTYVACEAVYSMDGDQAPLKEMVALCNTYHAHLVVDEAHSTGIWGLNGAGWVAELGLTKQIFALISTFGKAMGVHGAAISGSQVLKDYLVNFARPFVYTTGISDFEVLAIREAFSFLKKHSERTRKLFKLNNYLNEHYSFLASASPIKTFIVGGNKATKEWSLFFKKNNFDIRPILSPTVGVGQERLRICLHAFNSKKEIDFICKALQER